ncbi:MAG: hypothetical protein V7636_2438 [Actinomycetota bacterium]
MAAQTRQIDLGELNIDRDPEIVRPSRAVQEQWLREALADQDDPSRFQLLETLVGLCELRVVPDIGGSTRADAWRKVLTLFLDLGAPSPYVGAYKVQLDTIVAVGSSLAGSDRVELARLILDRTAATAVNRRDYRFGVRAARDVDPSVLDATNVIGAVLRPCVRLSSGNGVVATAMAITCEALAGGSGDCVTERDEWALRAAVDVLTDDDRQQLHQYVERMSGTDHVLLDRIITPERSRRRWSRGRALTHR